MATKAEYRSGILNYFDNTLGLQGERVQVLAPNYYYDDFTGPEVDTTNSWVESIVNGSTTTTVAGATNGTARLTSGGADDDDHELSSSLHLLVSKGVGMEARVATGNVAHTGINIGLTDAVTEAADLLAFTYATTVLTTTATNAALFFSDSDATSNVLRFASVNADVDSAVTAGSLLVDGAFHTYRVEIDALGNVNAYYDGTLFATVLLGIATTAVLCAYIGIINRDIAANTLDIDYIRYWSLTR